MVWSNEGADEGNAALMCHDFDVIYSYTDEIYSDPAERWPCEPHVSPRDIAPADATSLLCSSGRLAASVSRMSF